jgi:hypothetical protein
MNSRLATPFSNLQSELESITELIDKNIKAFETSKALELEERKLNDAREEAA